MSNVNQLKQYMTKKGEYDRLQARLKVINIELENWDKVKAFAGEIRRIAKMYYVQTPNYFFPIEPHFLVPLFHWLPMTLRLRMIMRFQLGCFPKAADEEEARRFVEACRLLTKRRLQSLFPDAVLHREWLFFLVKSFILIRYDLV